MSRTLTPARTPTELPPLAALREAAMPFALPLVGRFRGIDLREGMVISGPSGWGEFAPFDDYDVAATARWLATAIEASHGSWPEPRRAFVRVNAIIPAVDSGQAALLARQAVLEHGCDTVKVKVGSGLVEDEARVAAIRDVLGSRGAIRIDANTAWSVEEATTTLRRLSAYGLEYVEQPCATLDACIELRRAIDVPIAVDESLRRSADPMDSALHARIREAADVLVIKAQPVGGVAAGLAIAESIGIRVVVSGSLDSSVGLASGIALAAALPVEATCGLGTGSLLAADLVEAPLVPVQGALPVLRPAPDLDRLLEARARLDDERAAAWFSRLDAAYAALEASRA